ncbi:PhzF family phenazine biosynthesis protein [Solihabitans fulvus]|uniref:PhzF family phenazine biosynthesis protein n=1 Tax=Solihabitans fulvus TaxID=1892852 RepID=A0A5B2XMC3_9PSEU|nr:PhzF family phenazine biosynthesis protein [Solihabitans fulvus]KAA2264059.1 PhzF family phenazine biosynthesis protein [Solihabitans fulvus]
MRLADRTLRYDVLDVFTDRAFEGNPLAVVHGAEDLATAELQAIASEFNLSETAFPMSPTGGAEGAADYRLRIFTPIAELPFAGLPSIGTAWLLARDGVVPFGAVVQQSAGGLHSLRVDERSAELTGGEPALGEVLDAGGLAEAIGLTESDVDRSVQPRVAGCGIDFGFLAVQAEALTRAVPEASEIRRHPVGRGLAPVAFDRATGEARMRMFRAAGGEDPATGAAVLGLGVWLVDQGLLPGDGESRCQVRQGVEMGRPSTLDCVVLAEDGRAVRVSVGGQVVPVAEGRIRVPRGNVN